MSLSVKILSWALIFVRRLRFPSCKSLVTTNIRSLGALERAERGAEGRCTGPFLGGALRSRRKDYLNVRTNTITLRQNLSRANTA